jgi:uncharacterized membrane protein YdbT with pleckstrin-like domain
LSEPNNDGAEDAASLPDVYDLALGDTTMATTEQGERTVWKGSPSQVVNLGLYIICFLTVWLVVPLFVALWKWLELRCVVYELTTERLKQSYGVFSKRVDELELYRVRDIALEHPFFLRLFSRADIVLETSDKTTPRVVLKAIPDAAKLADAIREHVEIQRQRKQVREVDFE